VCQIFTSPRKLIRLNEISRLGYTMAPRVSHVLPQEVCPRSWPARCYCRCFCEGILRGDAENTKRVNARNEKSAFGWPGCRTVATFALNYTEVTATRYCRAPLTRSMTPMIIVFFLIVYSQIVTVFCTISSNTALNPNVTLDIALSRKNWFLNLLTWMTGSLLFACCIKIPTDFSLHSHILLYFILCYL